MVLVVKLTGVLLCINTFINHTSAYVPMDTLGSPIFKRCISLV